MGANRQTGKGLEAEEPQRPTPADVSYWLGIYTRLSEFTQGMLDQTRRAMADLPGPARRHLQNTNIRIMEEEMEVFRQRLRIWRELGDVTAEADEASPSQEAGGG